MRFHVAGGTPRRFALALLTTAAAGAVAAPLAMSDPDPGTPDLTKGWTQVEQTSTYYGNADTASLCPGATKGKGIGGGCFPATPDATYVKASLADMAGSGTAGEIQFQAGSGATAKSLGTIGFCGATGYIKIPTGTATIFVSPDGPVLNTLVEKCAKTAVGTTGTATLDSYIPPPPNTGSTGTGIPSPAAPTAARSVAHARAIRGTVHRRGAGSRRAVLRH